MQASVANNTTTIEVGSDAGESSIFNGDVENYPKLGLSPGLLW